MTNPNYTNLSAARKRYEIMVKLQSEGKTFNFRAWAGMRMRLEIIARMCPTEGLKTAALDRADDCSVRARKALKSA